MEPDFGGEDFRAALEALRFNDNGDWVENSQPLLSLVGETYDPMFLFDFRADCTLKIRPEVERISGGDCYIARINSATRAEELAYACLRTQV